MYAWEFTVTSTAQKSPILEVGKRPGTAKRDDGELVSMASVDYRIECTNENAADWLSRATRELDEISRSIDATLPDDEHIQSRLLVRKPVLLRRAELRVLADRDVIRGHVQSLRCRLSCVTRDPSVAQYLQAELSQLQWTAQHCVRQMRLIFPNLRTRTTEARAS